jgi:hypothetical protein
MMKKIIYLILVGFVGSWANAETVIPTVKVNCEDVKLSIHSTMEGDLSFSAYWNDPASFPEPPKYTEVGDSSKSVIKKFKFECPTLKVSYDGNVTEIKSTNYSAIVDQIPSFYQELDLFSISGYQYPNIKKGFFNSSYKFNLKTFDIKTSIYDLVEGQDLNSDLFKYMSIKKDSIVGYKIDGAELKPLLYDRKISQYKDDFNTAKSIDIFHKVSSSNVGVVVQRMYIDKENGILRIYKKSPFPQK